MIGANGSRGKFISPTVQYVPLGDVIFEGVERNVGQRYSEVRSVTNSQGMVPTSDFFDNTRTSADTRNYKVVRPGMFAYNPSRVNVGSLAWLEELEPVIVSPMYVVLGLDQNRVIPEYLELYLKSNLGKRHIEGRTEVGARFRLTFASMAGIQLPLPSLEVQRGIVSALGTFTKLERALEAELEARRQQYAHYREVLMGQASRDVPSLPFGELARITRGASPRPIQDFLTDRDDGIPWIKIGDTEARGKYITHTADRVTVAGAEKSRRVFPGDFVLSNSMSFGRPYIMGIEGCIHDGWLSISDFSKSFDPDFLYYMLRSDSVQSEFARRVGGGTVQNLNADIVRSVVIPVPEMGEQTRIVEMLDEFDALINDASAGLPAELAKRRKQYEHYRDRLLTFDEAS